MQLRARQQGAECVLFDCDASPFLGRRLVQADVRRSPLVVKSSGWSALTQKGNDGGILML